LVPSHLPIFLLFPLHFLAHVQNNHWPDQCVGAFSLFASSLHL
jgi:hypothetical protein